MKKVLLHIILFFILVTTPLYGQDNYSEFERGLQLSEPQRAQTEEARRRYMDELQGLNQHSINKRLELQELYRNPSANQERIGRLQRELGAINDSRHNLYNQYRSDMSRVLTPEQRERYNSFVGNERRRMMNRPTLPPSAYRTVTPPAQGMGPSMGPQSPRRPAVPHTYGREIPSRPGIGTPMGPPPTYRRENPPVYRPMTPPGQGTGRPPGPPPSRTPGQGRYGR
jgi:Spy/CpxP family protein refolding chaperone